MISTGFLAPVRAADMSTLAWVERSEVHPSQRQTVCRNSGRQHTFPFATRQQVWARLAWVKKESWAACASSRTECQ